MACTWLSFQFNKIGIKLMKMQVDVNFEISDPCHGQLRLFLFYSISIEMEGEENLFRMMPFHQKMREISKNFVDLQN